MPYGMEGGDTKESDAFMERCVSQVKKTGRDEGSAIAICKTVWKKKHANAKACYEILNKGVIDSFNKLTDN